MECKLFIMASTVLQDLAAEDCSDLHPYTHPSKLSTLQLHWPSFCSSNVPITLALGPLCCAVVSLHGPPDG